jgi:hypothetical protein
MQSLGIKKPIFKKTENLFTSKCPEIVQEIHPEKNQELDWSTITFGSKIKAWWKCRTCKYEWYSEVSSRYNGKGCPGCAGKVITDKNRLSTLFPNLVLEWHPDNPIGPDQYHSRSHRKVKWKCQTCDDCWEAAISGRTSKKPSGCPYCKGRYKGNLAENFPELIDEWSSKNDLNPNQVKPGTNNHAIWKCRNCSYEWKCMINQRVVKNSGCPACVNQAVTENNMLSKLFPELVEEWHSKNEKTPDQYVFGSNAKVWWKCKTCNYEWKVQIANRSIRKTGCLSCNIKNFSTGTSKTEQLLTKVAEEFFGADIISRELYNIQESIRYKFNQTFKKRFHNNLKPDIVLKLKRNVFIEFDGYFTHGTQEGIETDKCKSLILLENDKNNIVIRIRPKKYPSLDIKHERYFEITNGCLNIEEIIDTMQRIHDLLEENNFVE